MKPLVWFFVAFLSIAFVWWMGGVDYHTREGQTGYAVFTALVGGYTSAFLSEAW